jgi:hypothetical protein
VFVYQKPSKTSQLQRLWESEEFREDNSILAPNLRNRGLIGYSAQRMQAEIDGDPLPDKTRTWTWTDLYLKHAILKNSLS